jgi:hypothetical protein
MAFIGFFPVRNLRGGPPHDEEVAIWSAEFGQTGASLRQPLGHFRP